jgi:DNA-binding response OmpR family regulator
VLGQAESIDLIIADLGLPDSDGIDTFRDVHAVAPKVPAIVVTGMNVEELGLEAVREGAEDYLVKGFITGHEMMRSVLYAIERSRRRVSEAALSRAEADYRT